MFIFHFISNTTIIFSIGSIFFLFSFHLHFFSVGQMETIALKARQFPSLYIEMKDGIEDVLKELDDLMRATFSQTYPRWYCMHCKSIHRSRAAALEHAQHHYTSTTPPHAPPTDIIKDFSFTLHTCSKCPSSFTTKANLLTHLHTHTLRKLWACSLCSYTSHYHCSVKEHIHRTHSTHTNIFCKECPPHSAPYFRNTFEYLRHLATHHDNMIANSLAEDLMTTPEPAHPEVCLIS